MFLISLISFKIMCIVFVADKLDAQVCPVFSSQWYMVGGGCEIAEVRWHGAICQ